MKRYAIRAAVGALVALSVACGLPPFVSSQGTPAPDAPNILVIVTDDQRADHTLASMPAVRRWFQRRGTTFTNAFATTPLCCPSRASIMTGQYAHNHGVHKNSQGDEIPQQRTIQRALWQDGYNSLLAGKYLNGWAIEQPPPFFDNWAMQKWGYYDSEFNVNGVVQEVGEYSVKFVADEAIRFLEGFEADDDTPWFAYVAPFAAHKPFVPQDRYLGFDVGKWQGNPAVREKRLGDKPEFAREREISREAARAIRRNQLRTLISADDLVGRVMRWLRGHGEMRDTLAVFVSDNGRSWGEHRINGKRLPYTESAAIPLMIRWPDHFRAGARDDRLVTNLDITATLWRAARLEPRHRLDGFALQTPARRKRVLLEHWGHFFGGGVPSWASIRTRSYQYTEYYGRQNRRIFREYYDLEKDPWMLENLFHNDSKKDDPYGPPLRARLASARRCGGDSCP